MVLLNELISHKRVAAFHGEMNREDHPFEPFVHTKDLDTAMLGQNQTSHNYFLGVLRCLFDLEDLFPTRGVFLDLGSGVGAPAIYAAHHGWQTFGIEAYEPAYRYSLRNVAQARFEGFIEDRVRMRHGTFFPTGFEVRRHSDEREDRFRAYFEQLHVPHNGVYSALGLTLDTVDIFYHYQVERRDNILRLVAEYGKKGAVLVFAKSFGDTFTLPANVRKIGCFEEIVFVYQVTETSDGESLRKPIFQ